MPLSGLQALIAAISGTAALDGRISGSRCLTDDSGNWLTYDEVAVQAAEQAAFLRGFAGGVALLAPRNDVEGVLALLAAWSAGMAVALIDPAINPAAREAILAAFRPEVTYTPGAGLNEMGVTGAPVRPGTGILLSTSGTTGSSKFVRLQNAAIFSNVDQIARVLRIRPQHVGVCHLPLHYSYGLSVLLSHLERGAAAFLTEEKITSPDFSPKIAAVGGTHFPGVPFHYTVLARFGLDRLTPGCVTTFTQAGGHLDPGLRITIYEQASARGGQFYVMYGQTEAAPRMTTLASEKFLAKPASVGSALPGGRLEIIDENGAPLPNGATGRIIYRGPNVMWGYATSRDCLIRGDEMEGRLDTGDIGWLDEEGDLFITGRNYRVAKVAGLRIGLDEVERRLKPTFEVALLPDAESILVFSAQTSAKKEELAAYLSRLAEEYTIPSRSFIIKEIDAIPHLASGKVDFIRLRKLA